jgi:hypothetical protein
MCTIIAGQIVLLVKENKSSLNIIVTILLECKNWLVQI